MSPTELVREKALSLLADPNNGLNPAFVAGCKRRKLEVPFPAGGSQAAPFTFGPNSPTVFRMRADINWLERESAQQYPCIIAYGKSAVQRRTGRPMGSIFFGDVSIEMLFYLAWDVNATPPDDNFESTLDALEEAVLAVLNANPSSWYPVVYSNLCDIAERLPLTVANDSQLVRRGLRVEISAIAAA